MITNFNFNFNGLTLAFERGDRRRKHKKIVSPISHLFHPQKRSPLETEAQTVSEQERAGQTAQYDSAGKSLDAAQGTYGQFEGPVDQSPFYKSLLRAGRESTSDAYRNAQSNVRSRAKSAGFGYAQPVAQGAESELGAREAKDMAGLPDKAMQAAAPLSLEAARGSTGVAGERAGMGTALGGQGLGYFGEATGLEKNYQEMATRRREALMKAISSAVGGRG